MCYLGWCEPRIDFKQEVWFLGQVLQVLKLEAKVKTDDLALEPARTYPSSNRFKAVQSENETTILNMLLLILCQLIAGEQLYYLARVPGRSDDRSGRKLDEKDGGLAFTRLDLAMDF